MGYADAQNADIRECEKEKERANKSCSKHSRAIKISEETGREWESQAASGESVSVVWEEIMETKKVVLCCVPMRYHRNNGVGNDTVYVTLHGYRLRRSGINNPLSIAICFEFLYNIDLRRVKKSKVISTDFHAFRRTQRRIPDNTVRAFKICICMMHKRTKSTHVFSKHFCCVPPRTARGETALKVQKSKL